MKESILIVADEGDARGTIRQALFTNESKPMIVDAQDIQDAIGKASRQKFDLVIADSKPPKIDGTALVREFAALDYSFRPGKTIVISGEADEHSSLAANGVSVLAKPFNTQALVSLVAQVLGWNKAAKSATTKVDAEFIAPFVEGALDVIKTLTGVEAKRDSVYVRKDGQASGDVSALIPMNSDEYLGSMAVSFQESCFLKVVSKMLGEEFSVLTPEIQDAAAEICNQIFGFAKAKLNAKGHTIQKAIPSVVTGKDHVLKHGAHGPCLVVKFLSEAGAFTVEAVVQAR